MIPKHAHITNSNFLIVSMIGNISIALFTTPRRSWSSNGKVHLKQVLSQGLTGEAHE